MNPIILKKAPIQKSSQKNEDAWQHQNKSYFNQKLQELKPDKAHQRHISPCGRTGGRQGVDN